ncbi:MAG: malate synthase G [Rhodobacteraceae bacterium]|nr:malate synthase G [Paracoccaceae bacterium]MCY4197619.1 malate synthase G [Paracoccaceae bacterium]MCY4325985.1 malate synthase G [Paracoccaceae bacterium]
MVQRVERFELQVDAGFADFIENQALPGTAVPTDHFWRGLSEIVHEFGPRNRALLLKREDLQDRIDDWHREQRGQKFDPESYRAMLGDIGYIEPSQGECAISVSGLDPEIKSISGPQLVVPVTNARFTVNAANARWNSLYDALYGTDALGNLPPPGEFDVKRGEKAVAWAKTFLDDIFPLIHASHASATGYAVSDGDLAVATAAGITAKLRDGRQFAGFTGLAECPDSVLLRNHGLHVEIRIDRADSVGSRDAAGVADIILESAVTTIIDCEDSVAVVDAEDKIQAYRNWLGLMKGELEAEVEKQGRRFVRRLAADRRYIAPDGTDLTLRGLSLLLVRNVGLLLTTPAILDRDGNEIFEGLLDSVCTVIIALHDVRESRRNSRHGSVYVVKPKLHGSQEAAFTGEVFSRIEKLFGLPANTVKIGIMDEERRTTVNLRECIRAVAGRIAFINTGFLDRTGDEIHTAMEAGAFLRKSDVKAADWLAAYEDWNVECGVSCGLAGAGQIGKGMWAMPDLMHAMLKEKLNQPLAGASTAWVPSPTAAVLHATHYHRVCVKDRQTDIRDSNRRTDLARILNVPLAFDHHWSEDEIRREVENNLQSLLGYVVRWVDQGVGCSKVPDISDTALMEDRATCRISAQHIANWLHHGVVDKPFVEAALQRMAEVVDQQNQGDPDYQRISPGFDGLAYQAARMLVFSGRDQPSGYTEPILHRFRRKAKQQAAQAY